MIDDQCLDHEHPATLPRAIVSPAVRQRAARMLAAAGEPARLALLELLAEQELCVSELAACSGGALPAVSQRLRVLRTEGLVRSRRDGKHVYYALADEHVQALLTNILRHAAEPMG